MKRIITRDLGAGLLLLCGLLAFVPNLSGYFLSDDFVLLSWTRAGSPAEVAAFFDPSTPWFYRPGVKVVYWLGQSVFGLHAAPFHLFSLLLHGANGYLVYKLVARNAPGRMGWVMGLAAGLLFLLNPHHAETVSWIAAVGDLLGSFCILSSLSLFLRFRENPRFPYLLGSLILFTIGLFTRETVVVLPALLFLALLTLGRHAPWANKATAHGNPTILRDILYASIYLLPLLAYFAVQSVGMGGTALSRGGLQFRQLNLDSIALGVMDYVHGLVPGGSTIAALPLDSLRVVVWVELAFVALIALALWRMKWRVMLFGAGWLMITPLLFVFFNAPTDRYFYLPSIGYASIAAALIAGIVQAAVRWQIPLAPVKLTAAMLAVALLLPQGLSLAAKERAWHIAGAASGGVFHDMREGVPIPAIHAHFYFVDLPPFLDGVPTFQNALPQALHLVYGDPTLTASSTTCEELGSAELPEPAYFFRFKGNGAEQFASVGECRK
ncbi:MAG TPA: glycosyltransferase family 39 protein [Chloroflexia bacterium]|nr:glycosyltransferase family 39 protein [Chloroflexia bacterium]